VAYHLALVFLSLAILEIVWIALFVCCYVFFQCTIARLMTNLNLVIGIILVTAGFLVENQSVITASFVAAYIGYLTFSGESEDFSCNSLTSKTSNIIILILSAIFSAIWLIYSSYSLSTQLNFCECLQSEEEEEDFHLNLSFFQFLYAASACYLLMIVNKWGASPDSST
jgi:hypothetical protein